MAVRFVCVPPQCFSVHNSIGSSQQRALQIGHPANGQFRCTALATPQTLQQERRPCANYQPSIWSRDFINSLKINSTEELIGKVREEKLEEKVKFMINNGEDAGPLALLELIDSIERLGLGYRFEKEIIVALDKIISMERLDERVEKSVYATALRFRLLRKHGYHASQDVFMRFKDQNGDFKAWMQKDVKGLLCLYEASFFAFEGENLLDEAKAFSRTRLKDFKGHIDTALEEEVNRTLELPLQYRMLRMEARWHIEAYSKREDANLSLLELATVDFNMVQSTLQSDLQKASRWWWSTGLASKLNFIRDRLMECFFWTVGVVFEPQYSNCRTGLTQVTSLITTIDDVYDVYGSMDELELFTDVVHRWDVNAVKNLPDYMKLCFLALFNSVNQMAYDTMKEQEVNIVPILARAWADMCQAFMQEAQWNYKKHTPKFEAYLENGWRSVSGVVILVHAYFLMNQKITTEALESLQKCHGVLKWSSIIFRLCNDLGTSTAELERGESANAIACCMQETGLSEEGAREHIRKLIDEAWKKMNKAQVHADSPIFAKPFNEAAMNLARIAHCTYQHGDSHGAPDTRSKNRVSSLIIEPIKLPELCKLDT